MQTKSVSVSERMLNALASSCQCLVVQVMVAVDRPLLLPRNCPNAGPKSEDDKPCRYSSGITAATSACSAAASIYLAQEVRPLQVTRRG
ncbi:hypothetical protein HYG77_12455 [Rhodococcus sp. ZPP]|uniref:hypothetical protein n=1 Tax=Rhodococcus sp. ZPP TaxID=2749906 RepID=UPI001AD89224|nr:hypothetical protein [Rhodococcus sp. ZPP]QTJ66333.1 hypothetical protein HYG77_12455 [Rhodococcus sp. ZPP]